MDMMKAIRTLSFLSALVMLVAPAVGPAWAQSGANDNFSSVPLAPIGSAFTYQGYLTDGGQPANGQYDLHFSLYDAASEGTLLGEVEALNVTVSNGYVTVSLDFGLGVFNGDGRWLEIGARQSGDPSYTPLSPRQELTPAPYASYASTAPWTGLVGVPDLQARVNGACGSGSSISQINPDGSVVCEPDNDTTYTAGFGLGLNGTEISVLTSTIQTRVTGTCGTGYAIRTVNSDGSVVCEPVGGNPYTAGYGLALNGNEFSVLTSTIQTRVTGTCGTGYAIRTVNADGSVVCEPDNDTTYTAGFGLGLNGTEFSVVTSTIQTRVSQGCTVGSMIRSIHADGTVACETDANTTYTAGTGLTLTHNQFSLTPAYALPQSCNNDQVPKWNGTRWVCADDNVGSGNYWSLTGNAGTNPVTNFIGTTDNVGITFEVSGTTALRLEPGTVPNLIGGTESNNVSAGVVGATISGGGEPGYPNQVQANYGTVGGGSFNMASGTNVTIGGGWHNTASGNYSTVAGGYQNAANGISATVAGGHDNTASGSSATIAGGGTNVASGTHATVGGGSSNAASVTSATVAGGYYNAASGNYATVSGGYDNAASGNYATVAGGYFHVASGIASTVAGGYDNTAAGDYSFAAGRRAVANNQGCFVWGDSTNADVGCYIDNRWMARASGGVFFYTNSTLTSGMYLAAGGSSWNAVSNPALKEHFAAIDTRALVESLASIPITTWNYTAQDASIRHVGPMADDFNALLTGLGGEGEMSINSLDADGIALASIQGLYQMLQDKDASLAEHQAQIEGLQAETDALRLQVEALKLGGMLASAGVLSPSTLFSALACLLAGAAFLRTRKQAHQ